MSIPERIEEQLRRIETVLDDHHICTTEGCGCDSGGALTSIRFILDELRITVSTGSDNTLLEICTAQWVERLERAVIKAEPEKP